MFNSNSDFNLGCWQTSHLIELRRGACFDCVSCMERCKKQVTCASACDKNAWVSWHVRRMLACEHSLMSACEHSLMLHCSMLACEHSTQCIHAYMWAYVAREHSSTTCGVCMHICIVYVCIYIYITLCIMCVCIYV